MRITLNNFHAYLRKRRIQLGITQKDLGKALGYTSNAFICSVEKQNAEYPADRIPLLIKKLKINDLEQLGLVQDAMLSDLSKSFSEYLDEVGLNGKGQKTRRSNRSTKRELASAQRDS